MNAKDDAEFCRLMSPDRCAAWMAEHCPEFALPKSTLRALVVQEGTGLRGAVLPLKGTLRRCSVLVRPRDVVEYVRARTVA